MAEMARMRTRKDFKFLERPVRNIKHCIFAFLIQVPWTDLRYLFGEIMYGGHITDDWDRRLCKTYLEEYMKPDMVGIL